MREKMWKPGESGNPAGPPPRRTLEAIVQQMLDEKISEGVDAMTRREALAAIVLDEAMTKRNTKVLTEVMQRLWPQVQDVNINAKGEMIVIFDDQDRREAESAGETFDGDSEA